jgi:hypothetical protein
MHVWTSSEQAAPDSLEAKLKAQGKRWKPVEGDITIGAYVQDILEGRLDQPAGRGAVGKVLALDEGSDSVVAAKVDFGRGYSASIRLSELSLIKVMPK